MCGICGVYDFTGAPPDEHLIRTMNKKMFHRGPDDEGTYFSGPVGLGMRRLSIIDTQNGRQPIFNEDGTVCVVLNGEIYNYIELRHELEKKGYRFKTSSDTEVLVHLYEEEGVDGIDKLNGMFAFALFDQAKQSLWIARDRLGIKPLFYSCNKQKFIFSSDLASLNSITKIRDIDEGAFLNYLAFSHAPLDISIFTGIKKLLPGHWLWIDKSGVSSHQYWDIQQFQNWEGNASQAVEQLDELVNDSVQLQLRSDVPLAISLSGGIDSSAIAAYAKKHLNSITTFTVDFVGKDASDTSFARDIAKQLGTNHVEIPFHAHDLALVLDELIPLIDEPIADSAIIGSYLVAKKAGESGIKVLLNGAGGDEIFGGYHRHHAPSIGSTMWLAEATPKFLAGSTSSILGLANKDKSLRMQDPRISYGAGYSGTNLDFFAGILKDKNSYQRLCSSFFSSLDNVSSRRKGESYTYSKMYTDMKHYLVGDILSLSDKSMMACSVEGRVPLLDHRLVEFAFSLPESINILGNAAKGLFKEALIPLLPQSLLTRKKEGFNAPMSMWTNGKFMKLMSHELLVDTIPLFENMFRLERLALWLDDIQKAKKAADSIFRLYLFSRWYKAHVGAE